MADSDSGTHVTDIASASENGGQDDADSRKEGIFRPLTETGSPMESNLDDGQEHEIRSIIPSPMPSPRLTRFKNSINPELDHTQRSADGIEREHEASTASHTARGPYVIHAKTERDNHVPSYMSGAQQAAPDHTTGRLMFNRGSRKLHFPNRNALRAEPSSHVIAAHVHTTPHTLREIAMPWRKTLQRQRSLPPRQPNQGHPTRPLRRAESFSDRVKDFENLNGQPQSLRPLRRVDSFSDRVKDFENLNGQPQSRATHDLPEEYRRPYNKAKPKMGRHTDPVDVELGLVEDEDFREEDILEADKPWLPTGIYFVFLFTLWTAVLKIVDSVETNGPAVCAPGEEARLWACAGALALLQGIFEALWQRKSLFKALFSMVCLLSYMLISHVQPLSCVLGSDTLHDINKWQAAVNCFVGALLGVLVYRNIQLSVRSHKARKETARRRRRRRTGQHSDDEYSFDGVPT